MPILKTAVVWKEAVGSNNCRCGKYLKTIFLSIHPSCAKALLSTPHFVNAHIFPLTALLYIFLDIAILGNDSIFFLLQSFLALLNVILYALIRIFAVFLDQFHLILIEKENRHGRESHERLQRKEIFVRNNVALAIIHRNYCLLLLLSKKESGNLSGKES